MTKEQNSNNVQKTKKIAAPALLVAVIALATATGAVYNGNVAAKGYVKEIKEVKQEKSAMKKEYDKKIDELSAKVAANDNKINQAAKEANEAKTANEKQDKDIVELKK